MKFIKLAECDGDMVYVRADQIKTICSGLQGFVLVDMGDGVVVQSQGELSDVLSKIEEALR